MSIFFPVYFLTLSEKKKNNLKREEIEVDRGGEDAPPQRSTVQAKATSAHSNIQKKKKLKEKKIQHPQIK